MARAEYLASATDCMESRTYHCPSGFFKLKTRMYVNVDLRIPLGRQLVVPAPSSFHSGRQLVFLSHGDGQFGMEYR